MSTKVSIRKPAPVGAWDASVVTCLELTRERSQTDTEYKCEDEMEQCYAAGDGDMFARRW